jgi:hypothetical protein
MTLIVSFASLSSLDESAGIAVRGPGGAIAKPHIKSSDKITAQITANVAFGQFLKICNMAFTPLTEWVVRGLVLPVELTVSLVCTRSGQSSV